MSYDIRLKHQNGTAVEFAEPHEISGGTYAVGGTREAWLNITYNYGPHFRRVLDPTEGIRILYGRTVADTLPLLRAAADQLRDDLSDDYWAPTEGNARAALRGLIALGELAPPDAVWDGD